MKFALNQLISCLNLSLGGGFGFVFIVIGEVQNFCSFFPPFPILSLLPNWVF
jgi:hypothetical protein